MSERSSFFSGLSTFQVVAGALAAMTSAWVASSLGVAGTLIGAALGSLVLSISSAFYANTLHKGRTLVVQTDDGKVVEKTVEEGETAEALAEVADETGAQVTGAEVVEKEDEPGLPWRRIVVSTVVVLVISLLAIAGYEQVSDRSFGANTENSRITNPFGGGASSGSGTGQQDDGGADTDTDSDGSGTGDDGSSQQPPEDDAEPTPTPTPTPTTSTTPTAPTPTPTPDLE